MSGFQALDLQRACLVPSSVFASPDEVVASSQLSRSQKLAILRRWEFDSRRISGFGGAGDAEALLTQIHRALRKVQGEPTPAAEDWDELEAEPARPPAPGLIADEI